VQIRNSGSFVHQSAKIIAKQLYKMNLMLRFNLAINKTFSALPEVY